MPDPGANSGGHRLLLMPPLFWLVVFFAIPLAIILLYSVSYRDPYGGVTIGLTFENYARAFEPAYAGILLRSLAWAGIATIACFVLAYPMAYFTAFAPPRARAVVLFFVIVPFWTSFLIRMYSFSTILGSSGVVNSLLLATGVIHEPLALMHTPFSVILGFVYINLPFM